MEVNYVKYRKIRAVVLYSALAIAFICCYFEAFWFDDIIGDLLQSFGVRYNPIPLASQVMFAIIFAVIILSMYAVIITYRLESIEEHADDEEYYKVKRSFITQVIEGRYVKPANKVKHSTALPIEEVKTKFMVPGWEVVFDENLQLKCSMADFVRFCYNNQFSKSYTIDFWRLIDMTFHDKKGNLLSAEQLAQCNSDIQQRQRV